MSRAPYYVKYWFCLPLTVIWFEKLIYWKPLLAVCLRLLILSALKAPKPLLLKRPLFGFRALWNRAPHFPHAAQAEKALSAVRVHNRFIIHYVYVWLLNRQERWKVIYWEVEPQSSNHSESSVSCSRLCTTVTIISGPSLYKLQFQTLCPVHKADSRLETSSPPVIEKPHAPYPTLYCTVVLHQLSSGFQFIVIHTC